MNPRLLHTLCFITLAIATTTRGDPLVASYDARISGWASEVTAFSPGHGAPMPPDADADAALGELPVDGEAPGASLGIAGTLTVRIHAPLLDSEGADFAVFTRAELFPSLATVEVSSNGIDFYALPMTLNADAREDFDPLPMNIDWTNTRQIAGASQEPAEGIGFDLATLPPPESTPALDRAAIEFIRITDIGHDTTAPLSADGWPITDASGTTDAPAFIQITGVARLDHALGESRPFAPGVGVPGTTALPLDRLSITHWAQEVVEIVYGPEVALTWQHPDRALGPATGDPFDIVSLGRGGRITLRFDPPLADRQGVDLAVFENSFDDSFLELAYVEVSSDGLNFVRLPTHSLTSTPVGPFGTVDARQIDGLAGKYRGGYGTPFDLATIPEEQRLHLDLQHIPYVRIVDIVGDGSATDSQGRPIYDPTPTTNSAGFDLDGIAAVNEPLFALRPFAPKTGDYGSTAIAKDSIAIERWANGYIDYQPGQDIDENWQTPEQALGPAEGNSFDVVTLGRGGRITMTFDPPIADRKGFDFAVFENSFDDFFLELGYVEISSDGQNFHRFPVQSLTEESVQAFGQVDARRIDGFAGKYRQGYGTPFDIADLPAHETLDPTAIAHVRIIDVIGDGREPDAAGRAIYDPYPTIGSAGFDLDAIAVLDMERLPKTDLPTLANYFPQAVPLGEGWHWIEGFGAFQGDAFPWILHEAHGWLLTAGSGGESWWLWSSQLQWLWTNASTYPSLWSPSEDAWLIYDPNTLDPRWFFHTRNQTWFSLPTPQG